MDMIKVIKDDQKKRDKQRKRMDPDEGYDQWLFEDQPFLNRFCLMLLVSLRHEIERALTGIAVRTNESVEEISATKYMEKIWESQHKKNKKGQIVPKIFDYREMEKILNLKNCIKYKYIEPLRLLSNIFKHGNPMEPDDALLESLKMDNSLNYCEIFESQKFQEGLAKFIGLERDSDFCQIVERYLNIAKDFIKEVADQNELCAILWQPVPLDTFCE